MSNTYNKIFTNPYPNGWENLPSMRTPIIAQALQQHTNTIINIEDFLSRNPIATKLSDLENDGVIPTKTSQLTNDSGFLTDANIPTKISDLFNDSDFITEDDIPTNISSFFNDTGYVTNVVNNLLNYYLKSEVYNKGEINQLLQNNKGLNIEVVNALPSENISDTTIYLVPKELDTTLIVMDDSSLNLTPANDDPDPVLDIGDTVSSEEEVGDPFHA